MPPATVYRPGSEGEMSTPGVSELKDTTGLLIIDTTGLIIVDTGTLFTPIPATIYTTNDAI